MTLAFEDFIKLTFTVVSRKIFRCAPRLVCLGEDKCPLSPYVVVLHPVVIAKSLTSFN